MKRIACINTRSGNTSDCQILLKKLREELGPENVFDLSLVTPLSVLEQTTPDQIVCCGGDGTVAWAMSALDEFIFSRTKPVIAVVPLGTGNDLARALGWKDPFSSDTDVSTLLRDLDDALERSFDRWRVNVVGLDPTTGQPRGSAFFTMNNYLSIGCDAAVCKKFHELRESMPSLFSSRLGNKFAYTMGGSIAFFQEHVPLDKTLKVVMDGRKIEISPDVFGLMVLNISSYAGGADLYGSSAGEPHLGFKPQSFSDGLIEVVGVSGTFNLGAAACGLAEGKRIAQGKDLHIEFNDSRADHAGLHFQIDGEPSDEPLLPPSSIRIRLLGEDQPTRVLCKE